MQVTLRCPEGLGPDRWGAIEATAQRLSQALSSDDRSLAIGTAKELVESTARVVLEARGQTTPSEADYAGAVNRAHAALDRQPGASGRDVRTWPPLLPRTAIVRPSSRRALGPGLVTDSESCGADRPEASPPNSLGTSPSCR